MTIYEKVISVPFRPANFPSFRRSRFVFSPKVAALVLVPGLFFLAACAGPRQVEEPPPPEEPVVAEEPVVEAAPEPAPVEPVIEEPVVYQEPGAKVALLLPLSGRHEAVGQAMLNAAEMALFRLADPDFKLVVRDTGGTAQGAASAARQALDAGAQLILGPLFSTSVASVADEARLYGVPVITFSNNLEVAASDIFVMGITPKTQVHRIIGFAGSQGLRRFAAFAPDSAYGRLVARSMQEAVLRIGGEISSVVFYNPSSPDITQPAQQLVSGGGASFDAILLPVGGRQLVNMAPVLAYYDINPQYVRFLGTALWDNPNLGKEPALQGGWFSAPGRGLWSKFARNFEESYGSKPPRVSSLAYDAVAMAAVTARNATDQGLPVDFGQHSLTQPSGFSGIDGIFRFLPNGEAERELAVLELREFGINEIDPARTNFQPLIN